MTGLSLDAQYREATRDAELGVASCRFCPRRGPLGEFVVVFYGGGVALAMCMPCLEGGQEVRIRRGERGIEVYGKKPGLIAVASAPLGAALRRPK
jgi:hypothetical protein